MVEPASGGFVALLGRGRQRDARVGLLEQLADELLGRGVVALAERDVAHRAVGVDEVVRGPVAVAVVRPGRERVVEPDRVVDAERADARLDVARLLLERVLGRVDADDREARVAVRLVPRDDVRDRALAVDARVRPEVDEHDPAAQVGEVDGCPVVGVEPLLDAPDRRARYRTTRARTRRSCTRRAPRSRRSRARRGRARG